MSNRTEGGGHSTLVGQHNQFDLAGQRPMKKTKGLSASPGKFGDQYRPKLLNGKPPTPTGIGNMFSTQQASHPGVKKYQPYASSAGSFVPELPGKQASKLKEQVGAIPPHQQSGEFGPGEEGEGPEFQENSAMISPIPGSKHRR